MPSIQFLALRVSVASSFPVAASQRWMRRSVASTATLLLSRENATAEVCQRVPVPSVICLVGVPLTRRGLSRIVKSYSYAI